MAEITFADLSVEARTEVILEAAEESAWAIESTDKKIARLAELLKQQKAALGHGNWLPWVKGTFGDSDAAVWKVQRWMRGRSNNAPAHYLELDDEDEPQGKPAPVVTPRSERKVGRVEVVKPAFEPVSKTDELDENAVPPEPKTNTKHSKATAKAKEADRPAPAMVTPEIVDESRENTFVRSISFQDDFEQKTLSDFSLDEIFQFLQDVAEGDVAAVAKRLRKLADKLDPPTRFVKPDLDQCLEFFQSLDSDQGEQFYDFYASKGWVVGKVPMKDRKAAGRRWIRENEKGTFSNGNGQPRLTTTQQREQNTATVFNRFRQAAADAARLGDGGDVSRRIGAAGVIEADSGTD